MADEKPRKRRRTTKYTARIAIRLCEHIATGDSLTKALEKEPLAPRIHVFYRWLIERPDFKQMYEQARQLQAELQADKTLDMVEEILKYPKDAPAYRLVADIRKWTAEVRDPKRFGQKIQHELKAPPKDPKQLREEIALLEHEILGDKAPPNSLSAEIVEVPALESPSPVEEDGAAE